MLTAVARKPRVLETVPDVEALRAHEFARLDLQNHAYLDYTGAALYPDSLVVEHTAMLRESILGNPHAENHASLASTALITEARARVLRFFDADPAEYAVVFTGNASGAIAHVASGYRFGPDRGLVLSADNHNSINGVREFAARAGAPVEYVGLDTELRFSAPLDRLTQLARSGSLFAFPAQSNFSGVKHQLSLVRTAQSLGYRVLLDAAAMVPTRRLSLRDVPADFVAISFYKMFGYPSGVGALIAKREALAELTRPWFAGGTVEFVSVQNGVHALRKGEEGFEDGTANFLAIGAVPAGLDFLEAVGLSFIERHTTRLTIRLIEELNRLRHANGRQLVHVYGPHDGIDRGATVAFNVLDASGAPIPFALVEDRARAARVSVRGGCFCNPGASEAAFQFPAETSARCLISSAANEWSIARFAECMHGYAVGAIRASFGIPSTERDLRRLVEVVDTFTA